MKKKKKKKERRRGKEEERTKRIIRKTNRTTRRRIGNNSYKRKDKDKFEFACLPSIMFISNCVTINHADISICAKHKNMFSRSGVLSFTQTLLYLIRLIMGNDNLFVTVGKSHHKLFRLINT